MSKGNVIILENEMIDEVVTGLRKIFDDNICQIILYGSIARNEATSESDIDIAIILKEGLSEKNRAPFISFAAELDIKYERVFSIIDIEQKQMKKWGNVLPFYKNIQEEGIILWKAA